MQAKSFVWHIGKTRIEYPSYREAAIRLNVSEHTIRYYEKRNIHSEADKKWKRNKLI